MPPVRAGFPATVVLDDLSYPSVEHAFQAAKAGVDIDAAKAIREAPTPKQAHALGRKLALPGDWERRKRSLMLQLLRDKFRRDASLRERLLKTGTRNLVATNEWGETVWGVSGGKGANELGKALMTVRDEAATGSDLEPWLAATFPLAASDGDVSHRLTLEVYKKGEKLEELAFAAQRLVHVGKCATASALECCSLQPLTLLRLPAGIRNAISSSITRRSRGGMRASYSTRVAVC